jgi:hypothetical protein
MQALSKAIEAMVNLTRFAWLSTDAIPSDRLFASLNNCGRMGDVHILYGGWPRYAQLTIDTIGASPVSDQSVDEWHAQCCYGLAAMESLKSV